MYPEMGDRNVCYFHAKEGTLGDRIEFQWRIYLYRLPVVNKSIQLKKQTMISNRFIDLSTKNEFYTSTEAIFCSNIATLLSKVEICTHDTLLAEIALATYTMSC